MPAYVSMLRGINVRGKTIKMERLRAAFEALSFFRVRTYAQSGNVVFETTQGSPAALSKRIQERILRDFGFPVLVILKTTEEMERVVAGNPFAEEKSIEQSKLHVTFLSHALYTQDSSHSFERFGGGPGAVLHFEPGSLSLLPQRVWENQTLQHQH